MTMPPLRYRWILALAVPLLGWLLLFDGGFIDQHRYQTRLDSLDGLRLQLEADNERITREIRELKAGDPRLLEEEARRLGMIRPGDEVYYLVTDEDTLRLNEQRRRSGNSPRTPRPSTAVPEGDGNPVTP
jgi:cell division protein FtsB